MNHKRRRSPRKRGHCHLCKPWKDPGIGKNNRDSAGNVNYKRRMFALQDIVDAKT